MNFTTLFSKKFFRLRRKEGKTRKTGYYWVRYTYGGVREWRVGWYNEMLDTWALDGDTRLFYTVDLVEIDEHQIPRFYIHFKLTKWLIAFSVIMLVYHITLAVLRAYYLLNIKK